MKHLSFLIAALLLHGCNDNDNVSYPKLYVFSHVNVEEGKQWVVGQNEQITELPVTTGTFGGFYDTLDQFIVNSFMDFFFIEEIELMSEDMIRLKMRVNSELWDTTFSYTYEDEQLVIGALGNSNLFSYDDSSDSFALCASVSGAINGPNPILDPLAYHLKIEECNGTLEALVMDLLAHHIYQPEDTLACYMPRLVYK